MAKYNMSSKSDMKKFMKNLEEQAHNMVKQEALKGMYDIECPHCQSAVNVPAGKSICPCCKNEIDLELNFNL